MRFYRALLHFYPASFREEYADEMTAIFRRRRRDARGFARVAGLWIETIADVASTAMRVHVDILRQDVDYAVRSLMRARGYATAAIVVAALGIGATTAAFSIADHVLVRPLPLPEPDRLVRLWQDQTRRGYPQMELSPPNYFDWKRLSTSFEGFAAYQRLSANVIGAGEPERMDGASVTGELFRVLGVQAVLGRALTEIDDDNRAPSTVVLSHGLWRARFGGDASVLGRTITLNEKSHTIVGVMPPTLEFPTANVEFWIPQRFSGQGDADRTNYYLHTVARLKPGVSLEQARSELRTITAQLERAYPRENAGTGATMHLLRDQVSLQTRTLLRTLVAAAVCMLLIACTNLANLLLARGLARQKELAVRAAMGAGRYRLARQTLTESLVLAAAGGALGIALAIATVPVLARLVPTSMPIASVPAVDLRMLTLAALVTLISGMAFGVIPALRAGRAIDVTALRDGGRTGATRRAERLRSALVVVELTASIVLLVSSGLLVRALWRVQQIDPGFRTENALTLRTAVAFPKYAVTEVRQQFYDRILNEVRALPGVSHAAYTSFLPIVMGGGIWPVAPNQRSADPASPHTASFRFVTPGFFDAAGIPLVAGRDVSPADSMTTTPVAVVSESFAREHWPGEDPIGREFFIARSALTIVGVVGDIRVRGLEQDSEPQVYASSRQVPDGNLGFYAPKDLIIRTTVPPTSIIRPVRDIIRRVDPMLPIADVRTLEDVVAINTATRRTQAGVLAGFAAIAFVLAAVGMHGVLAFVVSGRTREIGVRMALGARAGQVVGLIVRQAGVLALCGIVCGVALSAAAARTLQSMLAGISPADPMTFATAIGLALLMTVAGSILPAIRALRVDPLIAIRTE